MRFSIRLPDTWIGGPYMRLTNRPCEDCQQHLDRLAAFERQRQWMTHNIQMVAEERIRQHWAEHVTFTNLTS